MRKTNLIHLRRPDGRDWDGILHVDPQLEVKAYALIYNPTEEEITRKISLPLYYTGLSETASLAVGDDEAVRYPISRDYQVLVEVVIPAKGYVPILINE